MSRPVARVRIREDNQGIESQLMGTSVQSGDRPFATLENIMIFDGADLTAPVGEVSTDWIATLEPGFVDEVEVTTFDK